MVLVRRDRPAPWLVILLVIGFVRAQDLIDDVGQYTLELRTAQSGLYQVFFTPADYPLHVFLNNKIYSEVNVPSLTSDVVVLLDALFATPTNNRNDTERYDLVKERCAVDNAIEFLSSPTDKFRFSFDMFAFTKKLDRLFLHADSFLCHKSSLDSRCSSGCQGNRLNRVRRSASEADASNVHNNQNYQLVMGPFIKANLIPRQDDQRRHKDADKSDYALIIGFFLVAFVIVGAYLFIECRVHKARKMLDENKVKLMAPK